MALRVLLVAPSQASLPQSMQEVEAVVNSGLSVQLLQSNVSQRDLVHQLAVPGKFDILWLATHSNEEGILLSSEIISSSAITSIIRGSGVKLVFLNTCTSFLVASAIQEESNVDVICTIAEVPDIDAYRTGALFAAKLALNGNFRRAYELSKPGNNATYKYLSAGAAENGRTEFDKLRRTVDELESAAKAKDKAEVHRKTDELAEIIRRINDHDGEISDIKGRVSTLEEHVFVPRTVLAWRMASVVTIVIAIAILLNPDLNQRFLVSIWNGAVLEAAIVTLAVVFWYVGYLTARRARGVS